MEVKTNPFYELRERLYAAAAAGCSVIAEDFRLRRAMEAFRPISEKNKAFASLYARCEKLLQSQDPASEIAGCIALADALAVAQGSFQDDEPSVPAKPVTGIVPQKISVLMMRKIIAYNNSNRMLPAEYVQYLSDPRVMMRFLQTAVSGGKYGDRVVVTLYGIFGDMILTPLLDAFKPHDPANKGQTIVYLRTLTGLRYASFFEELAQDVNAAEAVRIQAILALSDHPASHDMLLNLWQTEKGKIQTAAFSALLHQDAPEVQAAFEKKLAKMSPQTAKLLVEAGNVGVPYLRKVWQEKILPDLPPKTASDARALLRSLPDFLVNKTDADDIYLQLTANLAKMSDQENLVQTHMNDALMQNVFRFGTDSPFAAQVERLYAKNHSVFAPARIYLELCRDPEHALETFRDAARSCYDEVMHVLSELFYLDGVGWMLPCGHFEYPVLQSVHVFDEIPENLLEYLKFVSTQLIPHYGTTECVIDLTSSILETHSKNETVRRYVAEIADKVIAVQADDRVIKMIAEVGTEKNPEVMAARILLLTAVQHKQPVSYYRIYALERAFPQADMRKAIDYLLMGMSQNKEISKELLEKQRTVCADYIKRRFTDK